MTVPRLQREQRAHRVSTHGWLTPPSFIFPTPHSPGPATDLRLCVDFWVLLGTQEGKEEKAVTTSKREFPPICHRQGQVCHDLAGDEGGSREPERFI